LVGGAAGQRPLLPGAGAALASWVADWPPNVAGCRSRPGVLSGGGHRAQPVAHSAARWIWRADALAAARVRTCGHVGRYVCVYPALRVALVRSPGELRVLYRGVQYPGCCWD